METKPPTGPIWVPGTPRGNTPAGGSAFDLSQWDSGHPVLLMPVRIETKFVTRGGTDELRIRVLPDPATVHDAAPASAVEIAEAQDFWIRYHETTGADSDAAWREYVRRLGTHRAGYVARLTEPTVTADGKVIFADIDPEADVPGFASLLPERWMASGWVDDTLAFQVMGKPILRPLATSPDPLAKTREVADTGLIIDDATTWLFDYERAVEVGMAITVPLTGSAAIANRRVSTLLVVGLDEAQKPAAAANDLTAVFEQHSRSTGLAFVPQGTPTNNTETVDAGYRRHEREVADLAARELDPVTADVDDNASRLSVALGLDATDVFLRAAHGADREHARSRDMRIALFEPVLGTFLRRLLAVNTKGSDVLGAGLDHGTISALRDWFEDWVTGGAPVPTLRIGRQPYGILPVMARNDATHTGETKTNIADTVAVLIEEWRAALALVPALDHNATDVLSSEVEARDTVTAVLANNPHPRRLAIRTASDWSDQAPAFVEPKSPGKPGEPGAPLTPDFFVDFERELREASGGFRFEFDEAIAALNDRYAETLKGLYQKVLQEVIPAGRVVLDPIGQPLSEVDSTRTEFDPIELPRTDAHIRDIEEQLEIWIQTEAEIDNQLAISIELGEFIGEFHDYCLDVIEQLERHELRQRPLRWLGVPGLDGVLGRDDLQLLLTRFSTIDRLWQRATVTDEDPPNGVSTGRYLAYLATKLEDLIRDPQTSGPGLPGEIDTGLPPVEIPPIDVDPFNFLAPEFLAAAPLLFQLIDSTLDQGDNRAARSEAIARLAAHDPVELDWLMRETLGLGNNRLDAWNTSLATERLAAMRDQRPNGSYVGSYGFVLDLDRTDERPSNGFIHAPSLEHAASAAVLRSGWLARGSDDNESPAAVDLDSGRVREADWLLSGVRNGQDLGEMLGARFERGLHDARLDIAIRPLRLAVAEADGLGETAADQPIDGVRLLDLHRSSTANELDDAIADLALSSGREATLIDLLDGIETGFDATDDATTFEAVHQLVVGNLNRAAAVTDAMGPTGGPLPELVGVQTPRSAMTIDTRAVILIDAAATAGSTAWSAGTRDLFDPALDAWVASMLPAPDQVGWVGSTADGKITTITLDQLSMSALDACFLTSDDPLAVTPGLKRLMQLAAPGFSFDKLDTTLAGSAAVSLAEFQLVAIEVKRLIQEATPADDQTLGPAAVPSNDTTDGDTVPRVDHELEVLISVFEEIGLYAGWEDVSDIDLALLARIGLVQRPHIDPAIDFKALQARVTGRLKLHDAAIASASGESGSGESGSIEDARRRVATIIGAAAPLLTTFAMPGSGGVQFSSDLAEVDVIDDWFDTVSTVRASLGGFWRSVQLGALLGNKPPTLAAGQLPLIKGDSWAAVARPSPGTGGRIAVAAATHGTVTTGTSVVGLVLDQWAERIPGGEQLTGVSFHFDGPSAEAPQTMLLAVPPENQPWSTDLLMDTVLETIEWAQLRTVAIDDLGDYGHALPTTFVPGELSHQIVKGAST